MKQFVEITCLDGSCDADLFKKVVNQGIDAHLEAFTKSKFSYKDTIVGPRLVLNFHIAELPLLVRRLEEIAENEVLEHETAENWAIDIRDLEEFPK